MFSDPLAELVGCFGSEEYGEKASQAEWKLKESIREAEQEVLEALYKHENEIKDMCDESDKCHAALAECTKELEEFGVSMGRFLGDIAAMKSKTDHITTQLETQKELNGCLTSFIDKIVVTADMDTAIKKFQPTHPAFAEAVTMLDVKLGHVEEPAFESYKATLESRKLLYDLKAVASEKCRDFVIGRIVAYFSSSQSSITVLQQSMFSKTKKFYDFLRLANPVAANQIRQKYINYVSKVHLSQAQFYFDDLRKTHVKLVTDNDFRRSVLDCKVPADALKMTVVGGKGRGSSANAAVAWLPNFMKKERPTSASTIHRTVTALPTTNTSANAHSLSNSSHAGPDNLRNRTSTNETVPLPPSSNYPVTATLGTVASNSIHTSDAQSQVTSPPRSVAPPPAEGRVLPDDFSKRLDILTDWDKPVLPIQHQQFTQDAQFPEELFRSAVKTLLNTGYREWKFVSDYFEADCSSSNSATLSDLKDNDLNNSHSVATIKRRLSATSQPASDLGSDENSSQGPSSYPPVGEAWNTTRIFEGVFLKVLLLANEKLEMDFPDDYDVVSLAICWRLTDCFLEQSQALEVTFANRLLTLLQIKAISQMGKVVSILVNCADNLCQGVISNKPEDQTRLAPSVGTPSTTPHNPSRATTTLIRRSLTTSSESQKKSTVVPHRFFKLLLDTLFHIFIIANSPPKLLSYIDPVTDLVDSLITRIQSIVNTVELTNRTVSPKSKISSHIETYILASNVVACVEPSYQIDRASLCDTMAKAMDNLNEWAMEKIVAEGEIIAEELLANVCQGLISFVREQEAWFQEGNTVEKIDPDVMTEMESLLERQRSQWKPDLTKLTDALKSQQALNEPGLYACASELLRKTLTKYLLFDTRFRKLVSEIQSGRSDENVAKSSVSLADLPAVQEIMSFMKLLCWDANNKSSEQLD